MSFGGKRFQSMCRGYNAPLPKWPVPRRGLSTTGTFNRCRGDQCVTDLDLVCEFASQKLIDEPCDFRFIAEEPTELGSLEYERAHAVLGNHGSRGRLLGQKSDLANEVAFLQVRDLTTGDRDSHMARANEEQLVERLVFLGQRRALGDIAEPPGDEQPRNLCIVEAGEDTAEQLAIGLGQAEREAVLQDPIELVGVDGDEDEVPADPGAQIAAGKRK